MSATKYFTRPAITCNTPKTVELRHIRDSFAAAMHEGRPQPINLNEESPPSFGGSAPLATDLLTATVELFNRRAMAAMLMPGSRSAQKHKNLRAGTSSFTSPSRRMSSSENEVTSCNATLRSDVGGVASRDSR